MDLLLVVAVAAVVGLFLLGRRRRPASDDEVTGMRSWMPVWLLGAWMFWGDRPGEGGLSSGGGAESAGAWQDPGGGSGSGPGGDGGSLGGGDFGGSL